MEVMVGITWAWLTRREPGTQYYPVGVYGTEREVNGNKLIRSCLAYSRSRGNVSCLKWGL